MMFLGGFLSTLAVTFGICCIHQSSGYLVLRKDNTVTEGNILLQLLTLYLKNFFCYQLITLFSIHDSNILFHCLCLLALVGRDENTHPISCFLLNIFK